MCRNILAQIWGAANSIFTVGSDYPFKNPEPNSRAQSLTANPWIWFERWLGSELWRLIFSSFFSNHGGCMGRSSFALWLQKDPKRIFFLFWSSFMTMLGCMGRQTMCRLLDPETRRAARQTPMFQQPLLSAHLTAFSCTIVCNSLLYHHHSPSVLCPRKWKVIETGLCWWWNRVISWKSLKPWCTLLARVKAVGLLVVLLVNVLVHRHLCECETLVLIACPVKGSSRSRALLGSYFGPTDTITLRADHGQ